MSVTRFAPSPTGYLHLGHAYSAILNERAAREAGGRFLLRIEDIDTTRCRPEYEAAIYEDLQWLGIEWDERPLRQSQRLALYHERLDWLRERELVYRCFKTRKDMEAAIRAPHGMPDKPFKSNPLAIDDERKKLEQGLPYAWRLASERINKQLEENNISLFFYEETDTGRHAYPVNIAHFADVVLARKDIGTSYHLACTLDDAAQGVTHVIRGNDLRDAAPLHALLCYLFDLQAPIYRHHRLITNETGKRLSKRDKALTLREMRSFGVTAQDIYKQLGLRR